MNFIERTRRLAGWFVIDPGSDDDTPTWDRTGRVTKVRRALSKYPYLAAAAVFFTVALTMFFYPVLPSAHRNGWTLAAGVFTVAVAVAYWRGRVKAYGKLGQYHLNVLFTGRGIKPRLGVRTGDIDDRLTGFKKLRKFAQGGLSTAYEQFRDRYSRSEIADHKEKYHRAEADGSGDVVHGLLKNTTFEADEMEYGVDLFDSISVTHAGAAEERLGSKQMETVTSLPPVLDKRTSAKVEGAFRAEARARGHADQELELVKDQLDRLEEHVDPAGQPLFERTKQLFEDMKDDNDSDRPHQQGQSKNRTPGSEPEGI